MDNIHAKFQRARLLHQQGQFALAQTMYQEILAVQPNQLDTLMFFGLLAGETRDFANAVRCFDKVVAIDPKNAVAYCNRGLALQELDRFEEALRSFNESIVFKADYATAIFNRGVLHKKIGHGNAALEDWNRVIALNPGFVSAHYNRGVLLQERREWAFALASYETVISLKRDHTDAHINRGIVLRALGQFEAALASYDQALKLDPKNYRIHSNRGVALLSLNQVEAALVSFDRSLDLKPDYAEALSNRGLLHARTQRWNEAIRDYGRAIKADPLFSEAYSGRGVVLAALARHDEALADYERALSINPQFAQARFNRSLSLLSQGQFSIGWIDHEWRWLSERTSSIREKRNFAEPLWVGNEPIMGKAILVYSEQGLGDTLHFCRYIKLLASLGATVIFEVQRPLVGVLTNLEGVSQLVSRGESLPKFDFQCPLMSLPLAFKTTVDSIPASIPYLRADPGRVNALMKKLGKRTRPRVGLVWSGSLTHDNDCNRSISLCEFLQYLPAGAQYFCLQKEIRDFDQRILAHSAIQVLAAELSSFDDSAALCECMDIIISVDTSLAHLSGALGKTTWLLLSFVSDWRWLREREDSPWYPTVKLYRQETIGDWAPALVKIKTALIQKFDLS